MIRLYHGSIIKIEVPDLTHSKPYKDFSISLAHNVLYNY